MLTAWGIGEEQEEARAAVSTEKATMARSEAGEMIRFQEVLAGIQERMAAVAVRIMMAFHPRELVAVVVAAEIRMEVPHRMVLAAVAALAMEMVVVVVVVALMPVDQVELEEPVERLPIRIPVVVVGMEEMMLPLVKS